MLLVGRFLTGLASGVCSIAVPVYIGTSAGLIPFSKKKSNV